MILCLANILCTDHEPMVMATRFSSSEARALLLRARDLARAIDERWAQASLGGTRFSEIESDAAETNARVHDPTGVSLAIAPIAGLGFWHEVSTAGGEWRETRRKVSDERGAVVEISKALRYHHDLPLLAVIDSISEWREDFDVSFRRRIAYAIGFHASLRTGSLQCYEAWYKALILDAAATLDSVGSSEPDEVDSFSILLNLLARLHGTMAYERHHGEPDPRAPGRVFAYHDKVARLQARLEVSCKRLEALFNVDGRAALGALLLQLRSEHDAGNWNVASSPVWGRGREYL